MSEEPKPNKPDFACALCDADVFCLPAPIDAIPICMTCRLFCYIDGRWHGGREIHLPVRSYEAKP